MRIAEAQRLGERVDYLTFVPDIEPTLDANLGILIKSLRPLAIPIAVISNASLLWQPEVRVLVIANRKKAYLTLQLHKNR